MKKYRYKKDTARFVGSPVKGEVYEESYTWGTRRHNVGELVKINPDSWELVEDFVLPDRWCVKGNSKELLDYCNKFGKWKGEYTDVSSGYCHFPQYPYGCLVKHRGTISETIEDGYTEITEEQFLKYVIMKNEEIIGYKLKIEKYRQAALYICDVTDNWENSYQKFDLSVAQIGCINSLRGAGVLDLWFEPVYKPKLTLPTINGYDGKVDGRNVKYGCANFNVDKLNALVNAENLSGCRNIKSITLSSGVTVTMEEIKQIAEYCNN